MAELISTIDNVEDGRITWLEFMRWLIKEGYIRDIANDQRLFTFTLARLTEVTTFKAGQFSICQIHPITLDNASGKPQHLYIMVEDESAIVKIADETDLSKPLHKFEF